mgnify:CR=1 FL=1
MRISDLEPGTLVCVYVRNVSTYSTYSVAVINPTTSKVSIQGRRFFQNYPRLATVKTIEIGQSMSIIDYDGNKLDTTPVESFEVEKNSWMARAMIKDASKR